MELGLQILLIINILVCIAVSTGSFWYFKIVKSKYRWIKLFWGLEMLVYTIILLWTLLGGSPNLYTQYIAMLLPTTALLYGLVSAFTRNKEMKYVVLLEEKLNGDFERRMKEIVQSIPNKMA
jgi:hypothetical protein